MKPFAPRPGRDASTTIRGFVYQVDLTILRWLELRAGTCLELESGEDIDLIADALNAGSSSTIRLLEQVKHRGANVTLRSESVLEVIANAIEHRKENLGHELVIRFATNAGIGREQGLPAGAPIGMGLLAVWERLRKGEDAGIPRLQGLRLLKTFITGLPKPKDFNEKDGGGCSTTSTRPVRRRSTT